MKSRAATGAFASWNHASLATVDAAQLAVLGEAAKVVELRQRKMPHKEIARVLGITPARSEWLYWRARKP